MSLQTVYKQQARPALMTKFAYGNILAVPKINKVTVNVGVGRTNKDKKYLEEVAANIASLTGQRPVITKAKKSISAFKVKQGDTVGMMATLRGPRMWDFLDKLVNITLPRVRDFHGLNRQAVDQSGNLTIGFKEQLAFPEIRFDQSENIHGLEVNISTTAGRQDIGLELFRLLGFPFKKEEAAGSNN